MVTAQLSDFKQPLYLGNARESVKEFAPGTRMAWELYAQRCEVILCYATSLNTHSASPYKHTLPAKPTSEDGAKPDCTH